MNRIRKSLLVILLILLSGNLFAEGNLSIETKIEIRDATLGIGNLYLVENKNLMINELDEILSTNPEAYKQVKKAKIPLYTAMGLGFVGGGLIGAPLGASIVSGEEIDWTMIGIGASSVLLGQLFAYIADRYYEKGVIIYNQ